MKEEIINDLHWLMFWCFVSGFTFCLALWVNQPSKKKKSKSLNLLARKDLYCFECEIEMPVKEKNGRLSCTNCGLVHRNDY